MPRVLSRLRRLPVVVIVASVGAWMLALVWARTSPVATHARLAVPPGVLLFEDSRGHAEKGGLPGLYLIKPDGSGRRALAGRFYLGITPEWSPDGTRIVFGRWLSTEDALAGRFGWDLVVAHSDGTHATVIVKDGKGVRRPDELHWSPDGQRIAFDGLPVVRGDGPPAAYTVNADGTQLRLLMPLSRTTFTVSPNWAPDSRTLAYQVVSQPRTDASSIFRIELGSRKPHLLIANASAPSWSPHEEKLAYIADGDVYVLDLATGRTQAVTASCGGQGLSWSPDGRRLTFLDCATPSSRYPQPFASPRLVTVSADGKQRREVGRTCSNASIPEWSPDSRWLAYADCAGRSYSQPRALVVVGADGTQRHVIYSEGVKLSKPSWG